MSVLHLSEDAVYNRITAARAARRYPAIIEKLESGALSPTTVRLLARHLTRENHQELLAAASGKGKQAVEELLARRFPQPDVAGRVRKVRPPVNVTSHHGRARGEHPSPGRGLPQSAAGAAAAAAGTEAPLALTVPGRARAVVRPLAPERYEIRFTASGEMREKLRVAQDLLGHAIPSGDIAQVFDRALTLLVADLSRKKFAATAAAPEPRPIGRVAEHPGGGEACRQRARPGRCAFVSPNGRRCNERRFLEFHHVVPYAAGGIPTVENISCGVAPTTATRSSGSSGRASGGRGRRRPRGPPSLRGARARRELVLGRPLIDDGRDRSEPE